jgi:hypothetical protein
MVDCLAGSLCADVQLLVAASMGADATVQDWIVFKERCSAWSVPFDRLLREWCRGQCVGQRFSYLAGTEAELEFVRGHVHGEIAWKNHAMSTKLRSVQGLFCVLDIVDGVRWLDRVVADSREWRPSAARCWLQCARWE